MASREEKKRRQAIVARLAQAAHAQAEAEMPLSKPDLKALFDYLDLGLQVNGGCDRTATLTNAFLEERHLPREAILPWLLYYGGGCDCEVLGNVEEAWGVSVGSVAA